MTSPITFLKESYIEFTKVQWPTKQQTTRLTAFVIGVSLAVGLLVSAFDYFFQKLLEVFLLGS